MNRSDIPRDVQDMPRNELEAAVVTLRSKYLLLGNDSRRAIQALEAEMTLVYENLTATQKRCTELLEELRRERASNLFPGWTCACGVFNGEAKEKREDCRACGKAKHGVQYVGSAIVESTFAKEAP